MRRVDLQRLPEGLLCFFITARAGHKYAVIVVGSLLFGSQLNRLVVVLLCFFPLLQTAVNRNQVYMGLHYRWIDFERSFMRLGGLLQFPSAFQVVPQANLNCSAAIQRVHFFHQRVPSGWPGVFVLFVVFEFFTRFFFFFYRSIGKCQGVIGSAELRKQLAGGAIGINGRAHLVPCGLNLPKPVVGLGTVGMVLQNRLVEGFTFLPLCGTTKALSYFQMG